MGYKTAVKWDMDAIRNLSARQVSTLVTSGAKFQTDFEGTLNAVCQLVAAVVAECPKEWGAPSDPETYANLPYRTTFQEVITDFATAVSEDTKN